MYVAAFFGAGAGLAGAGEAAAVPRPQTERNRFCLFFQTPDQTYFLMSVDLFYEITCIIVYTRKAWALIEAWVG